MPSSLQFHSEERTDAADYESLLVGPWDLEYRQLSPGNFTASNVGVTLGDSVVYEEAFNRAVSVYGSLRPGLLGFSLPNKLARLRGRWWGAEYPPSAIAFATGGREIDVAFPGGYRNFLILVPEQRFRDSYRSATGEEADFLHHAFPLLPVNPASYSTCSATLKKLLSMPKDCPVADHAIISMMVEVLVNGREPSLEQSRPATPHLRSRVVRKAIELWKDSEYALPVRELTRLVGVSQRTLEHAFRHRFDLTPYQYLSRCRLGLVREALSQADPGCSTVTEIAMRYGFYELGRFSGEYRRFFGERPSETLSRRSGPRATAIFS